MGYKKAKFYDPIYNFTWHIQFGGDGQKASNDFKQIAGPDTYELTGKPLGAFITADNFAGGLLYFKHIKPDMNTISHECFHALMHLFRIIDNKFDEEPMAYYLGWMVDEVIKCRKK